MEGRELKTEAEIVAACNHLAVLFYKMNGYAVSEGCKMYEATHPQERGMWNMAVAAYYHIEGTDVDELLDIMEDKMEAK